MFDRAADCERLLGRAADREAHALLQETRDFGLHWSTKASPKPTKRLRCCIAAHWRWSRAARRPAQSKTSRLGRPEAVWPGAGDLLTSNDRDI
jgi:hypothetical protein